MTTNRQTAGSKRDRPKRTTCTKCGFYSFGMRKCLRGKVNPRTRKDTISVAQLMGPTYICLYNPWIASHIDALLADQSKRLFP